MPNEIIENSRTIIYHARVIRRVLDVSQMDPDYQNRRLAKWLDIGRLSRSDLPTLGVSSERRASHGRPRLLVRLAFEKGVKVAKLRQVEEPARRARSLLTLRRRRLPRPSGCISVIKGKEMPLAGPAAFVLALHTRHTRFAPVTSISQQGR